MSSRTILKCGRWISNLFKKKLRQLLALSAPCQPCQSFVKMSAKLIVHKIEPGVSLQSLCVTINDRNDKCEGEIKYSEWRDGQSQQYKKDNEKWRMVVKVATENEKAIFDLDSCAQEFVDSKTVTSSNAAYFNAKDFGNKGHEVKDIHDVYAAICAKAVCSDSNSKSVIKRNSFRNPEANNVDLSPITHKQPEKSVKNNFHQINTQNHVENNPSNNFNDVTMSPLEYSLQKVKKNNARIMENIQMLNRTLNYTKKNEILNIACSKSLRSYPCTICGKCFVYETGLKRHYSLRHSLTEIQPRWQFVWTCVECFQVWPRQDFAIRHANLCTKSENSDNVREIKTSSLLQCEFCEKVFTSIPRLLRHTKQHTTASNYECNECEINFWSFKGVEQHWVVCPWQAVCYKFSLPKLLLCNACDRKFRTYDQLYNHRYKVGHYTTKSYSDQPCMMSFVYQCELCGQSFPSIPQLHVHRTEFHPRYEIAPIHNMEVMYEDQLVDK